jgi:hypothetical protein
VTFYPPRKVLLVILSCILWLLLFGACVINEWASTRVD